MANSFHRENIRIQRSLTSSGEQNALRCLPYYAWLRSERNKTVLTSHGGYRVLRPSCMYLVEAPL